jgi:hypothetical protein
MRTDHSTSLTPVNNPGTRQQQLRRALGQSTVRAWLGALAQ